MGGGEAGDRNPEWTATDVIQAEPVAEFHAERFATVFAANAELDVRSRFASQIARHFHQTPDAALVDRGERICIDNVELGVSRQKTPGIVATHPESRLGEIVGAEAEELRVARNFVRQQGRARNLDHGADEIIELRFLFLGHFVGHAPDDVDLELQFSRKSDQRDHDFWAHFDSAGLHFRGRFENGARLHL